METPPSDFDDDVSEQGRALVARPHQRSIVQRLVVALVLVVAFALVVAGSLWVYAMLGRERLPVRTTRKFTAACKAAIDDASAVGEFDETSPLWRSTSEACAHQADWVSSYRALTLVDQSEAVDRHRRLCASTPRARACR
jgi:hypothetical protein